MRLNPASKITHIEGVICPPDHTFTYVYDTNENKIPARYMRGIKCRTYQEFFNEFSAALQFPYSFGENWPAFMDYFSDLDWLGIERGLIIAIYDADQLFAEEEESMLGLFVNGLEEVSETLDTPIERGEWWDRPAVPFRTVLNFPEPRGVDRWISAGANIKTIDYERRK